MANNPALRDLRHSVDSCLDALFRPTEAHGYWSEPEGRIIQRLDWQRGADGRLAWTPNATIAEKLHRYAPFALMGVAAWRASSLGHGRYDAKLLRNLEHYRTLCASDDELGRMPSYGVGPLIYTFARLHDVWPDRGFGETADRLAHFALSEFRFDYHEDALLLMGLAARSDSLSVLQHESLHQVAERMRASQAPDALYRLADDPDSIKHQAQMYVILGLAHVDLALGLEESAESIRRALEYTIERRMRPDGALLWHHYRNPAHRLYALGRGLLDRSYPPEGRCLFSCHQAFFVYAAMLYRQITKDERFDRPMNRAMHWIYGRNAAGRSVYELSGIGVPWRMMTTDGRTDWPSMRWIGSYEVGAMLLATVSLLQK